MVVGATLRFKVDRLLSPVGFRPLALQTVELPPIKVRHLHDEPVLIMCRDKADAPREVAVLRERWRERVAL